MKSRVSEVAGHIEVEHTLRSGGRESRICVTAKGPAAMPPEDSEAHFFKEHSWGFGTGRGGQRVTYEVRHPVWSTYAVQDVQMDWDWASIYGPDWAHLADQAPRSVFLAHGSEIAVSPKHA